MKTIQIKIHKKTQDERFGIQLAQQVGQNGSKQSSSSCSRIFVEHMDSDSMFVGTDLKVGMELLEIDLHGLGGKSPIDAAKMLQDSPPGDILIVARDHSRRSYPSDTMPTMRTVQVSIPKKSAQDKLGLILTQNPNSSQILIKQVLPTGAVAWACAAASVSGNISEQLLPGMQITEINLQGLAGKSVVDAVQMLREATGDVMIVARGNFVSVPKTANIDININNNPESKEDEIEDDDLGIVLQHKTNSGGASEMIIEKVSSSSSGLFANSGLQPRQRISAINGILLGPENSSTKEEAMELFKAVTGPSLTVVTLDSEVLQDEQQEASSSAPSPEQAPPPRRQRPSIVLNVDQDEFAPKASTAAATATTSSRATVVPQNVVTTPAGYQTILVTGSSGSGISLGMTQEYVYIHKIAPNSPFFGSVKEGQRVVKIQGMPCPLSLRQAMNMMADSSPLTLEVLEKNTNGSAGAGAAVAPLSSTAAAKTSFKKEITAIVTDKEAEEDLGITFCLTQNYVYVHGIRANSRFVDTDLCVGHRITKINGEDCPPSLKDTMDLIAQHVGTLRVDASEKVFEPSQVSASFVKSSIVSSIGIDVTMSQQGRVVISHIYPNGPLASYSGLLKVGQVIWSINGTAMKDTAGAMKQLESSTGKVTIVASDHIVAVAVKKHIDQKAGISVSKRFEGIVVHTLAKDGLFAGTNLREGQKIISICGVSCPNNPTDAAGLIQDCVGPCTIVAMDTITRSG